MKRLTYHMKSRPAILPTAHFINKISSFSSPSSWHHNPICLWVFCTRPFQTFPSLTIWLKFLSCSFFKSFITSSLHLFFGHPFVLTPRGIQSVTFSTSFTSTTLLRHRHHFIFGGFYISIANFRQFSIKLRTWSLVWNLSVHLIPFYAKPIMNSLLSFFPGNWLFLQNVGQ